MRVYLERHGTGLWSAILVAQSGEVSLRGYLNRKAAEHAASAISYNVYGRKPYFVEE